MNFGYVFKLVGVSIEIYTQQFFHRMDMFTVCRTVFCAGQALFSRRNGSTI